MRAHTRITLPILLATLAAACAPAGGPAVTTPSPTPTALPASAAPSAAPTAAPAATPSAQATPTPSPVATGTTIEGLVTDLAGAPLAGVRVTAKEFGRTSGFAGEGTTGADGRYAIPGAPGAVDLEVVARRDGWTPRRVVASVAGARHTLDFGGTEAGAARFLADHPEITATSPLNGALLADPSRIAYALTLSEPLDDLNRRRFAAAVRLMSANGEAGGGEDLGLHEDVYPFERFAKAFGGWVVEDATAFDTGFVRARVTWSADGLTATLAFDVPLPEQRTRETRFQVALAAGRDPIRDAAGHTLGTGPAGALDTWPAEGGLVLGAFYDLAGRLGPIANLAGPAARWAATHASYAGFRVDNDPTPPKLVEVGAESRDGDTHLRLTFDEPLLAYDGTEDGLVGAGTGQLAADLAGLTFAVGERGKLAAVRLDGDPAELVDPRARARFGEDADRNREFGFDPAAFATTTAGKPDGTITLALDERDPATLVLTIHGRSRFLDDGIEELKARAEGPADPAGNERDEDDADADVVTGEI